jgi:hypothetical protein
MNSTGNPFSSASNQWTSNDLILTDPQLREQAGVSPLDQAVRDVFHIQQGKEKPQQSGGVAFGAPFYSRAHGQPIRTQDGGSAVGAPFHIQSFGSPQAKDLSRQENQDDFMGYVEGDGFCQMGKVTANNQVGGFPMHYYRNNKKW